MLNNLKTMPYSERLKKLKLPSLKFRRIRGDLIHDYKILNNIDYLDMTGVNKMTYSSQKFY